MKNWFLITFLLLLGTIAGACSRGKGMPPVSSHCDISDFETIWDLRKWISSGVISLNDTRSSRGRYSLKARFAREEYPGIYTTSLPRDISRYATLNMDVLYEGNSLPVAVVRLDDRVRIADKDFFSAPFPLKEGWNTITVPLDGMKTMDNRRLIDPRNIRRLTLFIDHPKEHPILYLDNIYLAAP